MAKRKGVRCKDCLGTRTQHVGDDEGCWCPRCLTGTRCTAFVEEEYEYRSAFPAARKTDPPTSHAAAEAQIPTFRESHRIVLQALIDNGPMTDEELWLKVSHVTQMAVSGCRTRRNELVVLGQVRDSGVRRRTQHGMHTIVWEAVGHQAPPIHEQPVLDVPTDQELEAEKVIGQ